MTKAEYDELVRLRDEGVEEITLIPDLITFDKFYPDTLPDSLRSVMEKMKYGDTLNIAAAIAEYERAQEVNHE
jgi:hypothetical protein